MQGLPIWRTQCSLTFLHVHCQTMKLTLSWSKLSLKNFYPNKNLRFLLLDKYLLLDSKLFAAKNYLLLDSKLFAAGKYLLLDSKFKKNLLLWKNLLLDSKLFVAGFKYSPTKKYILDIVFLKFSSFFKKTSTKKTKNVRKLATQNGN